MKCLFLFLVQGELGKEIIVARRKGDTWSIAGASGQNMQQSLHLPLLFLTQASYSASIFSDGNAATEIKVGHATLTKGSTFRYIHVTKK